MKISIRLLFLLIFIGFVLPKMLPMLGLDNIKKLKQVEESYDAYDRQLETTKQSLYASLDALNINDNQFKWCIQQELKFFAGISPKSTGYISDAKQLKRLRCEAMGINSISGIENFTELTSLSLIRNNITSLDPLYNHPSLSQLDISDNKEIESVDALTSINTLTKVSFPNLDQVFCADIENVEKEMQRRNGNQASTNTQWIKCRGKANGYVKQLLVKQRKGESLSYEERRKVDDYLRNLQLSQ